MKELLLIALAFTLLGCKNDQEKTTDALSETNSQIDLSGEYKTACRIADGAPNDRHQTTMTVTKSTITLVDHYYESTVSCVANNNVGILRYIYSYNYDGATMTLTGKKKFYTILHNKTPQINALKLCKFTDWTYGVEREVTNIENCFGLTFREGEKEVFDNVQRQGDDLLFPKNVLYIKQ